MVLYMALPLQCDYWENFETVHLWLDIITCCHANSTNSQGSKTFNKSANGMSPKAIIWEGTDTALKKAVSTFQVEVHTVILQNNNTSTTNSNVNLKMTI